MPYYRKRRRRFRRKRYRKKKGRKSLGFKVNRVVARSEHGSRKYFKEERDSAIITNQNRIKYFGVACLGDRANIETMLQAVTTGSTHTGIGEADLPYSTAANLRYYKADISNYKVISHFRNLDEHPQLLTLYECISKTTRAYDASWTEGCAAAVADMYNGWDDYLATGTTSATAKDGQELIQSAGTNVVEVYSNYIMPTHSKMFNAQWKILKTKKFKLNPGDDVYWTMRTRNRVWNPYKIYSEDLAAGADTPDKIKGYTKVLIARVSGVLGRSQTAGEGAVIGLMTTDCAFDKLYRANILVLQNGKHEVYGELSHDDLTTKTLVGPTDDAHLDDQN